MSAQKKYIYDRITRITHAGIGGASLLLFISAKLANFFYENGAVRYSLWIVHIYLGYLLLGFLALRFFWFFKGPKYSKLSSFIKINEWKIICFNIYRSKKLHPIKWNWGHHPLASIAYLMVYLATLTLVFTGLFLARIEFDRGPLAEKYFDEMSLFDYFMIPHNAASLFIIAFTLIHLSALFWHQMRDKVPIFKSMKTGYQYKHLPTGDLENECE